MTFAELRAFLESAGWPLDELSQTTMRSRFRVGDRVFHIFIHVEPRHVIFAVIPYAHMPDDQNDADVLAERLLRYNREMNMAKFSVDEDGDVVLSVEYRIDDLDPSEVRDALDVLTFHAEKYRGEVERLSSL